MPKASKPSVLDQALEIYLLYPRKVGKPEALKAIGKVLVSKAKTFDELVSVTKLFAESKIGRGTGMHDAWHPATFFNQGHYDDDPAEWDRQTDRNGHPVPPRRPPPDPLDNVRPGEFGIYATLEEALENPHGTPKRQPEPDAIDAYTATG